MRYLALAIAFAAALTFPPNAQAACVCRCVNGQMQSLCSSAIDLPRICPPTVCGIVPPRIKPIMPPRVPPIGTTRCEMKQVQNPYTRRYEWKRICR